VTFRDRAKSASEGFEEMICQNETARYGNSCHKELKESATTVGVSAKPQLDPGLRQKRKRDSGG
jgi:hypothetical protein